jgi:hypothetical protein
VGSSVGGAALGSGMPTLSVSDLPSATSAVSSAAEEPSASVGHKGRRVRVVWAKNAGDHAWRSWIDRHRARLDVCTGQQSCPAMVTLHVSRSDGATNVTVEPSVSASTTKPCPVRPALMDCLKDVARDRAPSPDVCTDPGECRSEVLLAID